MFSKTPQMFALGFPDSSVGKEPACNVGDPGLIPGSGRTPGEGIGYPLQYSWASLVAQMVKNPSAMHKTWVWSLGWEDALEKETATLSSILAWRIPWTEKPGGLQPMGSQRVRYDWATSLTYLLTLYFRKPTKTVLCVDMYLPSLLFHGVLSPNAAKQSVSKYKLKSLQSFVLKDS